MNITGVEVVLFVCYLLLLFLSIFWLLVLFFEEYQPKRKKRENLPIFSVLVPAYNEEGSIMETLNSVVGLEYPKEQLQIIIINDGSTDQTKALVEQFIQTHPENTITLINQPNGGKGKALNTGLVQAQGEFFACLDADSFVQPNAIQAMLPYFEGDGNVAAVCPLLKVRKPNNILQKVQWYEYIVNLLYKFLNAKLDCVHVTPGPFSVYRTEVILKLGGYDETTITEDLEIAIRLQKHNYKIIQTFDTAVETLAPSDWKTLFWQRVRWYKGSIDNTFRYKDLIFNRKYGDFGLIRMPTVFLSGLMVIVLTLTLFYDMGSRAWDKLLGLSAINFDLWTIIQNFTINFHFLSLPFFKLFIAGTLSAISLFVMFYSYKVIGEKITNYGRTWVSLVTYLFLYSIFIAGVWMYIAVLFVTGSKKRSWG